MLAALHIVSDIQGFAVAVGILSDLFFPTGSGDSTRGERLRGVYRVSNDSPLCNAKIQVRHALVHIDRELDRWLKSKVGNVVGLVAIRPWKGPAPKMAASSSARIVDYENWRLFVLGSVMDLKPLILEVGRVAVQCRLEYTGPIGERWILHMDGPR